MKSTTDEAKELRTELKEKLGANSRQVSVRTEYYSMGSSIHVWVKDPEISLPAVKQIAKKAERISRCPITGDILSGGNTYVSVNYTREALAARTAKVIDQVQAAADRHTEDSNQLEKIGDGPFMVGRRNGRYSLWNDEGHVIEAYDVDGLCEAMVSR